MSTNRTGPSDALADVRALINANFATKVAGRRLDGDTHLVHDLGLDSMDLLTLVAAIENEFDQPVVGADEPPPELSTVGAVAEVVERMRAAAEQDDVAP
ncbi:acyl carrier protein [Haliangium sp.]|uniref:acyl carrier protein n=1 Tax=Haliangium sp. TaxID=2663208 RepID=UPI003D14435A